MQHWLEALCAEGVLTGKKANLFYVSKWNLLICPLTVNQTFQGLVVVVWKCMAVLLCSSLSYPAPLCAEEVLSGKPADHSW